MNIVLESNFHIGEGPITYSWSISPTNIDEEPKKTISINVKTGYIIENKVMLITAE